MRIEDIATCDADMQTGTMQVVDTCPSSESGPGRGSGRARADPHEDFAFRSDLAIVGDQPWRVNVHGVVGQADRIIDSVWCIRSCWVMTYSPTMRRPMRM